MKKQHTDTILPKGFDKPAPDNFKIALAEVISKIVDAQGVCVDLKRMVAYHQLDAVIKAVEAIMYRD